MLRLVIVIILALQLSACSRTQLVYRNADWLLEYYASQAADISETQRAQWETVLNDTLQKHRYSELAGVVAYLDMAGKAVTADPGSEAAACLVDSALRLSSRHARLAVDLAVPLLSDLDRSQIEHLADYTAQRQADLVERYLDPDPESRRKARSKRFNERIENWIGRMNSDQRLLVDASLARIPDITPYWLAYREQQTAGLLDMLEAGADAETLRQYLDSWWVEWGGRSLDYRRSWHVARLEFVVFLDGLGASLTPKQREILGKRIADLRNDLAGFLSPESLPPARSALESGCAVSPS